MRTLLAAVCVACLLTGSAAVAYLASPVELRNFFDKQRPVRRTLYLSYKSDTTPPQSLEVKIQRNGLWAKKIQIGDKTRITWKYGRDRWNQTGLTATRSDRRSASWDDWLFEPKVDVLLEITSRDFMRTRGLGKHPEGFMWVYGAHSNREPGPWFGLINEPLRLATWSSRNKNIGEIEFRYDDGHRYPDRMTFQRSNQRNLVFIKQQALWGDEAAAKLPRPEGIELDASRMPRRIEEDAPAHKDG